MVQPSAYSCARAYVVTRASAALTELEQLEADFKFFRGLTLALLIGPFEAIPFGSNLAWLSSVSVLVVVAGVAIKVMSDLKSPTRPPNPTRVDGTLHVSLALMVGGLGVLLAVAAYLVWSRSGTISSIAYVIAVGVVMLRFCQQRWQRNETTYEYASAVASPEDL